MGLNVLWLTPDKPTNVSVGRRRIADHLETWGYDVTLRGTTPESIWRSFRERHRYDALVGTTRSGALAGAGIKLLGGPPLVVDHVDPIRQFAENNPSLLAAAVRTLENLAFRRSDHVLYVYEEEADRVHRHARAATKTALGVEYDRFADPSEEVVVAARERLEDENLATNVAIYVGGLEPIYHVEEMLESVGHLEGWSLLVVGTGSLAQRVGEVASSEEAVVYLGAVPHETVPGYLRAADVGLSLVDDPHTLKVLEYGAAGLPVVQLRGRAEARFDDLVTYCASNPSAVAAAVERARECQSADALREFAAGFDWGEIASTYIEVVEVVAGDGSRA